MRGYGGGGNPQEAIQLGSSPRPPPPPTIPPTKHHTKMNKQKIVLSLGIFVGVLGASLLVGFGVLYLKPYLQVRTMEEADCAVISNDVNVIPVTCMCAPDGSSSCHSRYPCLRLKVTLFDQHRVQELQNITLYDSYETFLLQRNALQVRK